MKAWISSIVSILFSCWVGQCSAQSAQHDSIAKYLNALPEQTQFSIAIIKDGAVEFLGAVKNNGQVQFIPNKDSVFEVGSITKVFTSTILANTVKMGLVELDEPISKTLKIKKIKKDYQPITYKMLANHSSGIPRLPNKGRDLANEDNPYADYSVQKLEKYLENDLEIEHPPGTIVEYSNTGAAILGRLMELKRKEPYEDLLQKDIFQRLGMSSSTTVRRKVSDHLVAGRDQSGQVVPNWDLNAFAGAGAVLSTTNDLSKFTLANFQPDPVLDLQRIRTISINNYAGVGLAWQIIRRPNGEEVQWHNGGTGGYRSCMIIDPNTRKGVIVLSNAGNSDTVDNLCFNLYVSILK